jgi:CubicO group peptidase (beta-lactamase class C family)
VVLAAGVLVCTAFVRQTSRLDADSAPAELATEDDPTLAGRIDDDVAPIVAAGHLSGTLLIARGDQVVFEESWGMADHDHRAANLPATRFCVRSVTKPMTIALAALLIEQRAIVHGRIGAVVPMALDRPDGVRWNGVRAATDASPTTTSSRT